jgi:hypothetical protein
MVSFVFRACVNMGDKNDETGSDNLVKMMSHKLDTNLK